MVSVPPPLKLVAARNILGSGVVLGIAGGLLLWLMGYVGPDYFPLFVVAGAVIGGALFGIPGYLFEHKVVRERAQAHKEAKEKAASDYAAALARARQQGAASAASASTPGSPGSGSPVVVVHVGGQTTPYGAGTAPTVLNLPVYSSSSTGAGGAAVAPSWTPMSGAASPETGSKGAPTAPAPSPPGRAAPSWPIDEPLCVLETSRERDAWETAKVLGLAPEKVLGFTTFPPEDIARELGVPVSAIHKVSRVEGEGNLDPGDLEKIGNLIERHFDQGEGRVVVLPSVENLVEAGNVRNVRRLLEVVRDLAQGSHGSMLMTLDPVSTPEAHLSLLERGAHKIAQS